MLGRNTLLFFCLLILLGGFSANICRVSSGETSLFWLRPGTEASYALVADIFFDDRGVGYPFRCNYSWLCVSVNDTHAVLDVEVVLELFKKPEWTTPAHLIYSGMEFVEMAKGGDLSFIKRIPLDQVIGRIEILENGQNPGVYIPSPIVIDEKFTVNVDLDTMMMIDDVGITWGRWVLWIDPLKYPLEGNTEEIFLLNWLGRAVDVNVSYKPSSVESWNTIFGSLQRFFVAVHMGLLEDDLLAELGLSGMLISYRYEPRTGIFLLPSTVHFVDDLLIQKMGVIATIAEGKENRLQLSEMVFVGDLNSDWVVNILDLTVAAAAFGTKPGDDRWNQVADVNKDNAVNIVDIAMTAREFGTQYIIPD